MSMFGGKGPDDLQRQIDAQQDMTGLDVGSKDSISEGLVLENQKERAELTKWQQDMSEEIEQLIHRLKQEVKREDGKWVPMTVFAGYDDNKDEVYVEASPLCSDECVWRIVALLEPSTSKNLIMSKYEKDNILSILRGLSDTLAIDILMPNRQRFGIRMSDLSLIMRIFQTAAGPTYWRAYGANEKTYLSSVRTDKHIHMDGFQPKKSKSLLGM